MLGSVVNFTVFVRNGRKSGICLQNICSSRSIFRKLVEFNSRRELVGQKIALGIAKIVFILLDVSESALNLCQIAADGCA